MKIYKLKVEWESIFPNSNSFAYYDSYYGKVIRAKSEKSARKLANENTGDEGKIWEDTNKVSCKIITVNGDEEIILIDFLAG